MTVVVSEIRWAVSPDHCDPYRRLSGPRGPEPPPPEPPEPPDPVDPRFFDVILLVGSESGNNLDESPAQNGLGSAAGTGVNTANAKFGTKSMDPQLAYTDFGNKNDVFNISPTQMTEFTIEAWVYQHAVDPGFPEVICGKSFFGIQWAFMVQPAGDLRFAYQTLESGFGGNGKFTNIIANSTTFKFQPNQWTYVAVTKDAAKHFRLYLGDNSAGIVRMVGKRTPNDASIDCTDFIDSLSIGQIGLFGTNNWLGQIDEIRITRHVARYRTDTSYPLPKRAWPRPPPTTAVRSWENAESL